MINGILENGQWADHAHSLQDKKSACKYVIITIKSLVNCIDAKFSHWPQIIHTLQEEKSL